MAIEWLTVRLRYRVAVQFKVPGELEGAVNPFGVGEKRQRDGDLGQQLQRPCNAANKTEPTVFGGTSSSSENEPVEYIAPSVAESTRFNCRSNR